MTELSPETPILNDIQMTRAARATHATPCHSKQLKEKKKKEGKKKGSREKKKQPEGEKQIFDQVE